MKRKTNNQGFTLIEILVAMAMITLIFAMVFGVNSAISRAVRTYDARQELVVPVKKVIQQIARQIRCSYAHSAENSIRLSSGETPVQTGFAAKTSEIVSEKGFNYFSSNENTENILQLVTTSTEQAGLFEVAYKFDKAAGILYYDQRQFAAVPAGKNLVENWLPVAYGIDEINLKFFDGKNWQQSWDWFDQKQRLPVAVSIEITLKGEHNIQYRYETVAFAWSAQNRSNQTESRQIVSARTQ
jgi:prepilin-type N-terminal cleavage/methylation domain-containing protein